MISSENKSDTDVTNSVRSDRKPSVYRASDSRIICMSDSYMRAIRRESKSTVQQCIGHRFSVSDIHADWPFTAPAFCGRSAPRVHRSAALIEMAGVSYKQYGSSNNSVEARCGCTHSDAERYKHRIFLYNAASNTADVLLACMKRRQKGNVSPALLQVMS